MSNLDHDGVTMNSPRKVLLGICGGIAAYKGVEVASRLRKAGCEVHVAMTNAARAFVTPLTFAAITGNPVLNQSLPDGTAAGDAAYPHLYPATRADVFIVLPATAHTLAKLANGLASDLVATSALSLPTHCIRVICPAMNVEMWHNPAVQDNIRSLESRGWLRIGPDAGPLACGMEGEGRMSEPHTIVETVLNKLNAARPLAGRRILILSGPTREHFDPVRYIGNPSSGKMGRALALAAADAGAAVDFITGPVASENLPKSPAIRIEHIISAEDLLTAARARFSDADVVIYAAAVADYRPAAGAQSKKLPKQDTPLTLQLEPTPDVAATLNADKREDQVAIGFALQTHDGPAKAAEKMKRKNFDGIVLNALDALGGDTGTYTWLAPNSEPEAWGPLSKRECADRIIARAVSLLLNNKN